MHQVALGPFANRLNSSSDKFASGLTSTFPLCCIWSIALNPPRSKMSWKIDFFRFCNFPIPWHQDNEIDALTIHLVTQLFQDSFQNILFMESICSKDFFCGFAFLSFDHQ